MLDFTSALYLGFRHESDSLPPWRSFTLGKPSVLGTIPGTADVERQIADLVGCEQALLAPSTLHVFWDLFQFLGGIGFEILLAEGSYPIAGWGAQRACASGMQVRQFSPRDFEILGPNLAGRPAIVTDGFLPMTGRHAPLQEYLRFVRLHRGVLVVDDTQAVGLLGGGATASSYGRGGGGSLRACGLSGEAVVVVASLAKAFGVPVATTAGSREFVERFALASDTRVHCSPPSAPVVAAAQSALTTNLEKGDSLRQRLIGCVRYFVQGVQRLGCKTIGSAFPVQPVQPPKGIEAKRVHAELERRGIRAVLGRNARGEAGLIFCLTVDHSRRDINNLLSNLAAVLERNCKSTFAVPSPGAGRECGLFKTM